MCIMCIQVLRCSTTRHACDLCISQIIFCLCVYLTASSGFHWLARFLQAKKWLSRDERLRNEFIRKKKAIRALENLTASYERSCKHRERMAACWNQVVGRNEMSSRVQAFIQQLHQDTEKARFDYASALRIARSLDKRDDGEHAYGALQV